MQTLKTKGETVASKGDRCPWCGAGEVFRSWKGDFIRWECGSVTTSDITSIYYDFSPTVNCHERKRLTARLAGRAATIRRLKDKCDKCPGKFLTYGFHDIDEFYRDAADAAEGSDDG